MTSNQKILALTLAWVESRIDYHVKHRGNKARGICGVVPEFWGDLLKEKKVKVNSLKACVVVFEHLLENNGYDLRKAVVEYQGVESKSKMWISNRTIWMLKNFGYRAE